MIGAVRHLFVCVNALSSGKPACGKQGGDAIVSAVQRELLARGKSARVTACGCLGPCFDGPNAVVYPDNVWYGGLSVDDAGALADHLVDGTVVQARLAREPGDERDPE